MNAVQLATCFNQCFAEQYHTVLCGGYDEPVYLPAGYDLNYGAGHKKADKAIVGYRADYLSSALHEIAHWCIAGPERRQQTDYGYWYAADGRSPVQQAEFERVEARPQALEWIFSRLIDHRFQLSADNLEAGVGPSKPFALAVVKAACHYLDNGLPGRAARFASALLSTKSEGDAEPADRSYTSLLHKEQFQLHHLIHESEWASQI